LGGGRKEGEEERERGVEELVISEQFV